MSSTLMNISSQITRIVFPITIVLGIVTNLLNIIVLRRANFKTQSCAFYFLVLSIHNVIYACTCIIFNFLQDGLGIYLEVYSDFSCKFIYFLLNFGPHLSLYILVLASIDRYLCSSLNARLRRWSNIHTARWLILAVILFTILLVIGTSFMVHLDIGITTKCLPNLHLLFNTILLGTQIVAYVFIGPLLMMLFGLLTIHHTKQLRRVHTTAILYRPTDRQLTRMLIVQVLAHLIFSLPFGVVFFMTMIPTSIIYTELYGFLFSIFKIPFYIDFITPLFLYILSAKLYRREFMILVRNICRRQQNAVVHPN